MTKNIVGNSCQQIFESDISILKMDNTIFLQKQVRDNSEDLRSYIKDLEQWEENMKRKESDLHDNKDILVGLC